MVRRILTVSSCRYCPYHEILKLYEDGQDYTETYYKCIRLNVLAENPNNLFNFCPFEIVDDEKIVEDYEPVRKCDGTTYMPFNGKINLKVDTNDICQILDVSHLGKHTINSKGDYWNHISYFPQHKYEFSVDGTEYRRVDDKFYTKINGRWEFIGSFSIDEVCDYLKEHHRLGLATVKVNREDYINDEPDKFMGCKDSYTECKDCGTYNPTDAKYCFKCGTELHKALPINLKVYWGLLVLFSVGVFFIVGIIYNL